MPRRLNIGLFVDSLNNHFAAQACIGAELGASVLDANLVIFPGHFIGKPDTRDGNLEYEYQYNTVFNLVTENNIDVLYVLLGSIGSRADLAIQKAFLDNLPKIPIVTLFTKMEGYMSITFNNETGFADLIKHVVVHHGARNIGYVSGPKTNRDAIERLDILKKYTSKYGVDIDDDHIVYGDFTDEVGDVVEELLQKNGKLDAIIFANDRMALGGYEVLKKKGIMPGKDIIVTGFDDDLCASAMEPPLTTVEASSADLVYQAVINANEFIKTGNIDNIVVDTSFLQRQSCGCEGIDLEIMSKRFGMDKIKEGSEGYLNSIQKYLFGVHNENPALKKIKGLMNIFDLAMADAVKSEMEPKMVAAVVRAFGDIMHEPILNYTNIEKVHNWIQTIHYTADSNLQTDRARVDLAVMLSNFYRKISYMDSRASENNADKMERISQFGNAQMSNIYLVNYVKIPYEILIKDLNTVAIRRAYMYVTQGDTTHTRDDGWTMPRTILLKGIVDENGARGLPEEQELIRTENMFNNEFMIFDRRQTFVASPLFVGQNLYGFLVCELSTRDLGSVTPITYQTSVALKTFRMIDEQQSIKRGLEASLEQFRRDNITLSAISKSDELTGLYNRRGFLEFAQNEIKRSDNYGKEAVICYFDLDDLKVINDVHGHDEGDFALKETASILNDTFRHTDIIGRIGGDEFVVFAIVGVEDYQDKIKARVATITDKHNNSFTKPYRVEMSSGICQFKCGPDLDIYKLLEKADEELYIEKKAKKKGRNK